MQPRDPSCPAPPPFFVRALIPIWRAIVRAYGKVSLGEVRAKHETRGLSALMKPCFAIFFFTGRGIILGNAAAAPARKRTPEIPTCKEGKLRRSRSVTWFFRGGYSHSTFDCKIDQWARNWFAPASGRRVIDHTGTQA